MRRIISIVLMAVFAFTIVKAQGVIVSGKVSDETGSPMDMVHIRLSKGSIGTLSNFKGEYELRVPKSDTIRIIFTSLGYKRVERVVSTLNDNDDDNDNNDDNSNLPTDENGQLTLF